MLDQWNLDKSMAFYKDRFADASDFTFVFVGNFDAATKPLVERYLGGPAGSRRKELEGRRVRVSRRGVIWQRVVKGLEPKSQAAILFSGIRSRFAFPGDRVADARDGHPRASASAFAALREDLGGTYSVSASAGYSKIPREEYTINIAFGCGPDRTGKVSCKVFRKIEQLKTNGPSDKQVSDVEKRSCRTRKRT